MDCDDSLRNKNLCCRHPLIVDFETIGWDWIIAPRRYDQSHTHALLSVTKKIGSLVLLRRRLRGINPRTYRIETAGLKF
jgi:hypothetical protein